MERVRLSYVLMINAFGMDLPDYHVLALRFSISRGIRSTLLTNIRSLFALQNVLTVYRFNHYCIIFGLLLTGKRLKALSLLEIPNELAYDVLDAMKTGFISYTYTI